MEGGGGGAEGGGGTQVKRRDEASGLEFWLYTPAGHDASAAARWPLLLFLHGAGESGRDLDDLISTGATGCPPVELAHGRAAPSLAANFVVASPQTDRGWGDADRLAKLTNSLLGDAGLALDPARLYATGVSMGGAGCWTAGTTGLFAAIAPVCGAGSVPVRPLLSQPPTPGQHHPPSTESESVLVGAQAASLDGVAVWAFHGANDAVVPVRVTDRAIEELKRARTESQQAEIKYTRYDEAPPPVGWEGYTGHASWIPAYREDTGLFEWLLSHKVTLRVD